MDHITACQQYAKIGKMEIDESSLRCGHLSRVWSSKDKANVDKCLIFGLRRELAVEREREKCQKYANDAKPDQCSIVVGPCGSRSMANSGATGELQRFMGNFCGLAINNKASYWFAFT